MRKMTWMATGSPSLPIKPSDCMMTPLTYASSKTGKVYVAGSTRHLPSAVDSSRETPRVWSRVGSLRFLARREASHNRTRGEGPSRHRRRRARGWIHRLERPRRRRWPTRQRNRGHRAVRWRSSEMVARYTPRTLTPTGPPSRSYRRSKGRKGGQSRSCQCVIAIAISGVSAPLHFATRPSSVSAWQW